MALNVSYNYTNTAGIDTASVKEVAKQIFERANVKSSALTEENLAKFNRPSLGSDLYSGRIDANAARQISMANSGMQVQLSANALNNLKYLNNEASKAIFKRIEGKITLPQVEETAEKPKTQVNALPTFGKLIEVDFSSGKRGSNPFYKGETAQNDKDETQTEEVINLFA